MKRTRLFFGLTALIGVCACPRPMIAQQSDPPADDGLPGWPFFLGATVVVAAGAIWAVRRRA